MTEENNPPNPKSGGLFSSLESANSRGALSTFPPPRLLDSFRNLNLKGASSTTTAQVLPQAHPSIGKDCPNLRYFSAKSLNTRSVPRSLS